jgi:ABC-type branched-subunit amino acid transport system substrate-binding protein
VTIGMQIRLWWRDATVRERWITGVCIAAALALLVGSLALRPSQHSGARAGTLSASAQSAGTAATAAQAQDQTAAGQAATTAAGGGPGTTTGTIAGALNAAGGGAVGTSSGGVTGPADTIGLPGLIASDRGVTASTIKIGFLLSNPGGLSSAGYALNIRTDTPQYAQALADYANKNGGIGGRKVVVGVRKTDPTSQSDQAAACQAMVNDQKVFGVVDVGSLADTPAFDCLANQNQTPFIHNTIWSTDWLARSHGMEVGYPAAIDRISQTWSRDLAAAGWLAGHPTVGILGDKCEATQPIIQNVLKPAFERAGAGKVVVAMHDCDLQSVAAQPPGFVSQFQLAGVTRVLLAANYVSSAVFMKTAQSVGYHPKYSVSDWWQLTADTSAKDFDADQFDGAIAIASNGLMLKQSGKAPYPGWQRCSQVATDAGLPPVIFDPSDAELWGMCDNFFLMLDGIKAAGANPTRQAWAQAIQHLGEHDSVIYGRSFFKPGKVTGSDFVHTLQWQRGCACFKSVSDFRPAVA